MHLIIQRLMLSLVSGGHFFDSFSLSSTLFMVMWALVSGFVRRYFIPVVAFPIALVVGTIGYNLESLVSDRKTPSKLTSINEDRDRRLLSESLVADPTTVASLKEGATLAPGSILKRNLSPSLREGS